MDLRDLFGLLAVLEVGVASNGDLGTFVPGQPTPSMDIKESDESKQVSMNITADPNCTSCEIVLPVYVKGLGDDADIVLSACNFTFYSDSWDTTDVIDVLPRRDMFDENHVVVNRIMLTTRFLSSSAVYNGQRASGSLSITAISVNVVNVPTSSCHAYGNLYIKTFDGNYYDFYGVGTFAIYRSKTRNFEVQIRTWSSGLINGTFICAVVVREGNDVIAIDMCQGKFGETTPMIAQKSVNALAAGTMLTRHENGKDFKIYLPSGAVVASRLLGWYGLTVVLNAPPTDFGKTEGLCGMFDNNRTNDFTLANGQLWTSGQDINHRDWWSSDSAKAFGEEWRVSTQDNLFNENAVLPGIAKVKVEEQAEERKEWCICKRGQAPDCGYDKHIGMRELPSVSGKEVDVTNTILTPSQYKSRISKGKDITGQWSSNNVNLPSRRPVLPPTENTKHNEQCTDAIRNSTMYDDCSPLLSNLTDLITQCVQDIALTNNPIFLENLRFIFEQHCKRVAVAKQKAWGKGMDLFNGIKSNFCPGQCSGHGQCKSSICMCDSGHVGNDCSIVQGSQPVIRRIEGPTSCDVTKEDCTSINVIGGNFINNGKLTGKVEQIQTYQNSSEGTRLNFPCDMINIHEVKCKLPQAILDQNLGKYSISLSNDNGGSYGTNVTRVIYKSQCVECGSNGDCNIQQSFCLINNTCHPSGALQGFTDVVCDPSVSSTTVVKITDGGWGNWTRFGACSVTCGEGVETRTRLCDSPSPSVLGKPCNGKHREQRPCKLSRCPVEAEAGIPIRLILFIIFLLILILIIILLILLLVKATAKCRQSSKVKDQQQSEPKTTSKTKAKPIEMEEVNERNERSRTPETTPDCHNIETVMTISLIDDNERKNNSPGAWRHGRMKQQPVQRHPQAWM